MVVLSWQGLKKKRRRKEEKNKRSHLVVGMEIMTQSGVSYGSTEKGYHHTSDCEKKRLLRGVAI